MKKLYAVFVLFIFLAVQNSVFAINEKNFWDNYNDPNLTYFISRALESNLDIKIAAVNSDIYKHYIMLQRSYQLPSVNANFSPAYAKFPGKTSFDTNYSLPLQVSYEADIFLKNRDKTLLSKKDYEMSLFDEESVRISIASMIGTIYFNILKFDKTIRLQEEIVSLREEIYNLMKLANAKGSVSSQDVIRAYKAYLDGKAGLNDYKKLKTQSLDNLAFLVGTTPDEAEKFLFSDIENVNYNALIPASIPSDIITNRPDYKKAELMVERAGLDIKIAKKEFLPSLTLTGTPYFMAGKLGSLFSTKSALISLGASVAGDLFAGGRKIANLRVKKSEYQKSLINYEKTNLTAIQEVNDAFAAIKYDTDKFEEIKNQMQLETAEYNLNLSKFNQGVISKLDILQAKENLLTVKNLFYTNKAECFIDNIGLYKAAGANL